MSTVPFQAPGYHSITPSITVQNAGAAIDFYKSALGATEVMRLTMPDGKVMHGEIQIGDSRIMLSDEFPDWGCVSPQSIGGTASSLMIYVPDVDAAFTQAVAAGATSISPPTDQFWGDRSARILDPFGHKWSLATHLEEISDAEIAERAKGFC
jgi:PhnB protein